MLLNSTHVGIIGGGASGIFTLCNLVDQKMELDDLSPLKITLFEKNKSIGEGMAYRSDYASNLLNTAAGLLSDMDDDRQFCLKNQPSFLKWVRENHSRWASECPHIDLSHITKNTYLPRMLVGIYLRSITDFYIKMANKYNIVIHFICAEVNDICYHDEQSWSVIVDNTKQYIVSHAVLAVGGFLKKSFPEFSDLNHFVNHPWPNKFLLSKLLHSKTIGIIGTKLSALDTIGILKSHHYSGKIIMASRSGFLPSVKNVHHRYKPVFLTLNTVQHLIRPGSHTVKLNDVMNLVKTEIEYASGKTIQWEKIFSMCEFSMSWLHWQINMAKNTAVLWQSVLAAVSDFFVAVWHWLDESDKANFKKKFSLIWETYRFSMPLETATDLVKLIDSDALSIWSQIARPTTINKKFLLSGYNCVEKKWMSSEVDYLINTTGIEYDVNQINSILLRNLLRSEMITAHPDGGIYIDFNQFTILNQRTLFAIGDLTKGEQLFTNSYLVCANQAAVVAKTILSNQNTFCFRSRPNYTSYLCAGP